MCSTRKREMDTINNNALIEYGIESGVVTDINAVDSSMLNAATIPFTALPGLSLFLLTYVLKFE